LAQAKLRYRTDLSSTDTHYGNWDRKRSVTEIPMSTSTIIFAKRQLHFLDEDLLTF